MRAFADYETTREYTDFQRLPAGVYEITIIRAEDDGKALCLLFDISDGEFKDYYRNKFAEDRKSYADAKYKGVFRLWYPNGGQYDDNAKRRMKTALKTIKEDNRLNVDFTREWDGAALKGSRTGMIFREQEYDYNGKHGFTVQPFMIISLEKLHSGNYTLPEAKRLSSSASASTNGFVDVSGEDDLPF